MKPFLFIINNFWPLLTSFFQVWIWLHWKCLFVLEVNIVRVLLLCCIVCVLMLWLRGCGRSGPVNRNPTVDGMLSYCQCSHTAGHSTALLMLLNTPCVCVWEGVIWGSCLMPVTWQFMSCFCLFPSYIYDFPSISIFIIFSCQSLSLACSLV